MKKLTAEMLNINIPEFEADWNLRAEITKSMLQKANNNREEQIKQLLHKRGVKFETASAFVHVLKTRCNIGRKHNQINFYLDGQLLAWWYDTVETKFTMSEKGEMKFTSIFGAPSGRSFEDEYLNKPEIF